MGKRLFPTAGVERSRIWAHILATPRWVCWSSHPHPHYGGILITTIFHHPKKDVFTFVNIIMLLLIKPKLQKLTNIFFNYWCFSDFLLACFNFPISSQVLFLAFHLFSSDCPSFLFNSPTDNFFWITIFSPSDNYNKVIIILILSRRLHYSSDSPNKSYSSFCRMSIIVHRTCPMLNW